VTDSPIERYQRDLQRKGFVADAAQQRAVEQLQRLHEELSTPRPKLRFSLRRPRPEPVQGLYLWGGVGRGKTYLMDCFFETLPQRRKLRTHFHRFMLDVHHRRKRYLEEQDPVALVAEEIANEARVLCFDEFFVSDIADAMILGRLTEVLFREGVTLVATSNIEPDGLYRDGLQRERFVPAIERIKANCRVLHVDSPNDFRLRALTAAPLYYTPADSEAEAAFRRMFERLSGDTYAQDVEIDILGRPVLTRRVASDVVWFDFKDLCRTARAAADYIELSRCYHTVLLSGLPQLSEADEDAARRFVNLVDEFYDRGVKLVITADVPMLEIYAGRRLAFEFQRTESRLIEMQSEEYLQRPHLA